MKFCRFIVAVVSLTVVSPGSAAGQSFGRWHLPSTTAQFCGYGYGPGHHVPMIRVPGYRPMQIQRLTVGCPAPPPLCTVGSHFGCSGGCLESLPARDSWGASCYDRLPAAPSRVGSDAVFAPPASRATPARGEHVVTPKPADGSLLTPPMPNADLPADR